MDYQELELKLDTIQLQYSGKVPFSPLDDLLELENLYKSNSDSIDNFYQLLNKREKDSFWQQFIELFYQEVNKKMMISPWTNNASQISNNNIYNLKFINGIEIGMDAPTQGELWLLINGKSRLISDLSAASFIWSVNSHFFAYSEWTKDKKQIIRVVNVETEKDKYINQEFDVIQFESFRLGNIVGIDSPIYRPRRFCIDINKMEF